jgi:hypothetical protein
MALSPLAKFKLAIEPQAAENLHTHATAKNDGRLIKLAKDLMDSRDLLKIAAIVLLAGLALSIFSELFHLISLVGFAATAFKAKNLYDCVEEIHEHSNTDSSFVISLGLHEITELFGFKVS